VGSGRGARSTRLRTVHRQLPYLRASLLASGSAPAQTLELLAAESGVRVMSIHKSKGLEFDAVVIPAVEHEMFFGDHDEARAAFFVGISRARSHLLLTYASTRRRPPRARHWNVNRRPYQEFLGYAREPGQPPALCTIGTQAAIRRKRRVANRRKAITKCSAQQPKRRPNRIGRADSAIRLRDE
jgi:hypothetical protein